MSLHKSLFSRPGISLACVAVFLAGLGAAGYLVIYPWLYPRDKETRRPDITDAGDRERVPVPAVQFKDVTARAFGGRPFYHHNGMSGLKLLPETMGSGVAFIDYNNDGLQDILFVNSCDWPGSTTKTRGSGTLALYENNGDGTFTDVTEKVGLDKVMYGMGVCVGDFDNDGQPDVFITGVGGNKLFRNILVKKDDRGKETHRFEEVTESANLLLDKALRWPAGAANFLKRKEPINFSSSAAFLDYDGDGWLDLFVCNYVTWSPKIDGDLAAARAGGGKKTYGPPSGFDGAYCFLYRNKGKDSSGNWLGFEEVSQKAGIRVTRKLGKYAGKSLGVCVCDVDRDGFPDILVANDTVSNFFFHNQGNGTFKDLSEDANVVDDIARGGMGIAGGEYRPGRFGVVVGNFSNEPSTFLRLESQSPLYFTDAANSEGIAGPSRLLLKFGVLLFDYDLDGRLDLLTSNGALEPDVKQLDDTQDYQQPVQLFWNTGGKRSSFEPVTYREAGTDLFKLLVGRGCAYGDINGDGFPDLVLVENGGPARLLENQGVASNHRVRLVLRGDGKRSNTSAIGARVTLTAGKTVLVREVTSGHGYLSQSELPVTFGLGPSTRIDKVEIKWPGKKGRTQVLKKLKADRVYVVEQDKEPVGKPLRKPPAARGR
jgi:hypothetical protein